MSDWGESVDRQKTSVRISANLDDPDGTNPNRTGSASVHVLDQDGRVMDTWYGDIKERLSAASKQKIVDVLDEIRTLAEAAFLG